MCPCDATQLGVKETTPYSLFTTLRNRGVRSIKLVGLMRFHKNVTNVNYLEVNRQPNQS